MYLSNEAIQRNWLSQKQQLLRPLQGNSVGKSWKLTAFFHFGVNTFTAKEWGGGTESSSIFNPVLLDSEQWVCTVKAAGFEQVIITAKHHDGCCLWPTKTIEHWVKNSHPGTL